MSIYNYALCFCSYLGNRIELLYSAHIAQRNFDHVLQREELCLQLATPLSLESTSLAELLGIPES